MNKHLRIGLIVGAVFGLLYFLIQQGLMSSLITGGFMGGVFGWLSYRGDQKLRQKGIEPNNLGVNQIEQLNIAVSSDEAYRQCHVALQNLRRAKIKIADPLDKRLSATIGMSWESFGEKIRIQVTDISPTKVSVEIHSQPLLWTTIIDYGKNQENVHFIASQLRAEFFNQVSPT